LDWELDRRLDPSGQLLLPGYPDQYWKRKGVKLVNLAERICEIAKSGSSVRIERNRQSDVGAFIADVSAARNLFDLRCPEDPVEHIHELIDALRLQSKSAEFPS
jgi:hypothetical protein